MSEVKRTGDVGGGAFSPGAGEHRAANPTFQSPFTAGGGDRPAVPRRVSPMGIGDGIHASVPEPRGPHEHQASAGAPALRQSTEMQPNTVANFVLDNVGSYSELNAGTLEEGNQRFNEATVRALQGAVVGEKLGEGGRISTHRLVGRDDVVVKRLIPSTSAVPPTADNPELTQIFEDMKEEDQAVRTMLGPNHTPYAEFVVVDGTNFGDPDPRYTEGKEFVMVTEPLTGIKHNNRGQSNIHALRRMAMGATAEMRAQVDNYVTKIRTAQAQGILPDDEVDFDFTKDRVKQFDTNQPSSFATLVDESDMGQSFHENPQAVTTPQDLADFVLGLTPKLQELRGRP